jgi:hypothetical protein
LVRFETLAEERRPELTMDVIDTAGIVAGHDGVELNHAVLVCDLHTPERQVFDVFHVFYVHKVQNTAVCSLIDY